ncbi:hypothetical protein M422DRAFT_33767 [Sphaerobolus stellatus SS14]|uniref:Autophagy-related protein 29 n=1 Tax=Sphaerobolus stellatus (strain SS14) TaxID=990650 RepID=A0A0C9URM7_SPHS4|nr:hypothetical protein M422DRAFT_33767 [Sphaerobolus stellatus SS14]
MVVAAPPIHLIIRLPYNREDAGIPDPTPIQWNTDKENMLWDVIARSRAADSGGTDWPALSAHLQVPLPYLLYRAQVRYEEDLRGLQDIRNTLGTSNSQTARPNPEGTCGSGIARGASRLGSSSIRGHTSNTPNTRIPPQGIQANRMLRDRGSASVLALSQRLGPTPNALRRPPTPAGSGPSESDEEIDREEEDARRQEEKESVDRRLKELEEMMSSERLGFARPPRLRPSAGPSVIPQRSPLREVARAESLSTSESAAPSPQGSIPSIPSPPPETQSQTSSSAFSSAQATTTLPMNGALSPHSPRMRHHSPRRGLVAVRGIPSQRGSNHGSAASSFSDLSDVSASALESALMSNIRGAGSRLSMFARSHLGRGAGFGQ